MEFANVIKGRTSIRNYSEKPVEDEKINYVFECTRLAPSWANKQCWRFIVVRDKENILAISKTSLINRWLKTAPVLIIACGNPSESGNRNGIDYYTVDTSIALEHLVLAAADVGLGTCWIGAFDEQKIKELLEIPKRIRIVALTPLGYPTDKKGFMGTIIKFVTRGRKRRSLDEIVHYERW
jgi:nitroreductase